MAHPKIFNRELFILGAGSSVPAGLLTAFGLTKEIEQQLSADPRDVAILQEFRRLRKEAGEVENGSVNIESIYFKLEEEIAAKGSDNLRMLQLLRATIIKLLRVNLSLEDESRIEYLKPLCEYVLKTNIPIITLNWDNTVELAFRNYYPERNIDLGLISLSDDRFKAGFLSTGDDVKLIKVHGSLNLSSEACEYNNLRDEGPFYYREEAGGPPFQRNIILGGRKISKINQDKFLTTCMNEFKRLLKNSETIHIVGYSFGDKHINKLLKAWKRDAKNRSDLIVKVVKGTNKGLSNIASKTLWGLKKEEKIGAKEYFSELV